MAATAQLEREQNKEQVRNKMKARIERGYWCFCPPTGYKYVKDKDHGKLLSPIHPIADIIGEGLTAFGEDRLKGQVDLRNFLMSKNLHGLLGKKQIRLQHIGRLANEPLYTGFVAYPEWGITKRAGRHKAIITKEIYLKIQQKIKRPERKPRDTDKLEFPLRRVISCIFCGKPMTGSSNRGKNPNKYYPHYTCCNKDCTANPKNITASKVEEDYIKLLESIKVEQELLNVVEIVVLIGFGRKRLRLSI